MKHFKEYLGEFIGTFILVFFGCGAVAVAVLFNGFGSLLEVALVWGFAVSIAIFTTRNICPAHLNPAVSLAMYVSKNLSIKKLPFYIFSQFLGAFLAASFIYIAFNDAIVIYEGANDIVRGTKESYKSAMMFGEFFPNPSFENNVKVDLFLACFMEGFGTFILVFVIYRLTERKDQINNLTPVLIGLTVTIIICIVAPFTQAGLNPARDFAPRLVAYIAGWQSAAFPTVNYGFFTVYILSPLLGGTIAAFMNYLFVYRKKANLYVLKK